MEAYSTGKKHVDGKLQVAQTRNRVIMRWTVAVTDVLLTPDEAEKLAHVLLDKARQARPIVLVPGDPQYLGPNGGRLQ